MDRIVTTIIDKELCNGCGLCITVCPAETLTMRNDKATVTGEESLGCGHCEAVCPTGAIRVEAIDQRALYFSSFHAEDRWLPYGKFDTARLVQLMRSRRSCRNFTDRPVDRELLQDLVKVGITAPSGSNCQLWTFTILPDRPAVLRLAEGVADFYERLNRMAEKGYLRYLLKLMGKGELDWYYRNYYQSVREGLAERARTGRDRLFHGATAAIIVGAAPGASCPVEDALLATQNILLAAHSMGIGTCLIGFAVSAMKKDAALRTLMGIPEAETVCAVIALGHPAEKYMRCAGRKKPVVRYAGPA